MGLTGAATLEEVIKSNSYGLEKEKIYYSAPGKSSYDIKVAMDMSIIIADSINELHKIDVIAKDKGVIAQVGIRINPDFDFYFDYANANASQVAPAQLFLNTDGNVINTVK